MPLNRVKYYGIYDLATSHCLIKADELVIRIDSILDSMDINDIIECQNILYYIDAGVNKWSDSTTEKLKNAIIEYISKAKKNSINMLYKQVDEILHEEFWELFSKYHLFESNSEEEFKSFLFEQKPYIRFILQNMNLVKVYNESLKEYFLSNVENTIMLF